MYIDASAIVAVLAEEAGASTLLGRIGAAQPPFYVSPLTLYEATVSLAAKLARQTGLPNDAALISRTQAAVAEFVATLGAREILISSDIGRRALEAAKLYGRTGGHPADLNFGDCFAYACAKAYRAPLLYKGDDFAHTDVNDGVG